MWEVGEDQRIICSDEPEIRYPVLHYVNFWQGYIGVITEIDMSSSTEPVKEPWVSTVRFILPDNRKNYILGSDKYVQQYKFDATQDIWVSMEDW